MKKRTKKSGCGAFNIARFKLLAIAVAALCLAFSCRQSVAQPTRNSPVKSAVSSTRNRAQNSATRRKNAGARNVSRQQTPTANSWFGSPQSLVASGVVGVGALVFGLIIAFRSARVAAKNSDFKPKKNAYETEELGEIAQLKARVVAERAHHQETENLMWQMAMSANDVLFMMCPSDDSIRWYGQIDALLGYPPNAFPRTIQAWAERIHPEESEIIVALYIDSCRGNCEFKVEYRIQRFDGIYRDWLHRGNPVYDDAGNLLYLVGACVDVTERNNLQKRLRQSENEIAELCQQNDDLNLLSETQDSVAA